ncbi:hypothetical protein CPAR01_01238 [Colletotrichum paranaense]|uniref:Uncharacterized protein n=8 Tax=Colletotrichum acutatum species complex TaxID=2707335 RepID=A0A9Q0B474_9PEZI|nr:uncharacterized protein CLUP02_13742 [Colletotrichum lupini]XP_060314723.1 uncharacterized protein CCOS01_06855 [Colletotrichum costaricense]XP_060356384.1 uncharacterized protein CPAR01_01238 [Colletotrichum paranaense]XP_060387980.1 uncharacterized protein CTAM01_01477 [Colletotrichum tamarilloi]XP_060394359.1 uncharacterized protein CABS01_13905 [Colletotrichum abscissum]KAK0368606.1 hypothetical protein CLIM01_14035 [Colletotrichum limetticola]KAK1455257.1 hypothetical protein CMEL01_0
MCSRVIITWGCGCTETRPVYACSSHGHCGGVVDKPQSQDGTCFNCQKQGKS